MFQNRYKSIVCQEDLHLKELVRYIHLNLLRARLVEDLDRPNGKPWSGHSALAGKVGRPWQDTRYVLYYFGAPENSRNNYLAYVEKGLAQGHRPELVGGGLIRSLGGWSEVLASRKRGEKQAFDQRIPGDGDFVKHVVSDLDDFVKRNLRLSGQRIDMEAVAEKVALKYDVSMEELTSGSRRSQVVKARRALSWLCVRELGYSGADVARFLGVANSCVTRIISKGKMENTDDIDLTR